MNVCDYCGEEFSTPKLVDFAYSTETHPDGSKTIMTEPMHVSPCCEADFESEVVSEIARPTRYDQNGHILREPKA